MKSLIALTLSIGMAAGLSVAGFADCGNCPEKGKGSPTCGKEKASETEKGADKKSDAKSEDSSTDKKASADTTETAPATEAKAETK